MKEIEEKEEKKDTDNSSFPVWDIWVNVEPWHPFFLLLRNPF